MTKSISLMRPQVNNVPTVTQQFDADNIKAELNMVDDDVNNCRISDIAAMTKKTNLESKLNDTKAAPVKYVEDYAISKAPEADDEISCVSTPDFENTVKNLQDGKQYSLSEKDLMLTNQLNQMALNNKILHGLLV